MDDCRAFPHEIQWLAAAIYGGLYYVLERLGCAWPQGTNQYTYLALKHKTCMKQP